MSYDIWLEIDTGGPEPVQVTHGWNYTSNCSPMWRAAGANLAEFHDKAAGECAPILRAAIDRMQADPAPFVAMNPENGWGSYETLVPALEELLAEFDANPKATVRVWR
jgi:hypothetical protein